VLVEKAEDCLHYPWWAKKDHVEGNAKLSYSVAPEGSVSDVAITKSSGNADLDAGAVACVKSLKYRPHSAGDVTKSLKAEVTWSLLAHGPYQVNWRFAGSITETVEATQQLTNAVIQCLRGASGRTDFASGLLAVTGIWVQYDRGEVSSVSVLLSSGNDALDRFAVDCFKSQPADPERARLMRHVRTSKFAVVWPLYAHP
jgi:TonB family protein